MATMRDGRLIGSIKRRWAGMSVLCVLTGWLGVQGAAAFAQSPAGQSPAGQTAAGQGMMAPSARLAPVPPALRAAKTVFISNAGGDSGLFPHPFSGRPERGYDALYAGLKQWGRYELVSEPGTADLVLELQLNAPSGPTNADKSKGASDPLPMFRLTIYDRRTHYVLWALTKSIEGANLQRTHDKNFDDAMGALLADLKVLVGTP